MEPVKGALTPYDACLAHWLALVPAHLQLCARLGQWRAAHDALDLRAGWYGMGRN